MVLSTFQDRRSDPDATAHRGVQEHTISFTPHHWVTVCQQMRHSGGRGTRPPSSRVEDSWGISTGK